MIFPNLLFAIGEKRLAHYELCSQVGIERTQFSRRLNGMGEFSPREKERIAGRLEYPCDWLFREIIPPPRVVSVNKREMAEAN